MPIITRTSCITTLLGFTSCYLFVQVIDGLESQYNHGYFDTIKAITQSISENTQQLVFIDCSTPPYVHLVKNLLTGPVLRLCQNDSVTSHNACIIQSVKTCAVSDEKLNKVC